MRDFEHDELFANGMYTDLRNISGRNTCQNCSRRLTAIHHATMSPLLPGRRYCYQVGSRKGGFSRPYNFTASDSTPRPATLAVQSAKKPWRILWATKAPAWSR